MTELLFVGSGEGKRSLFAVYYGRFHFLLQEKEKGQGIAVYEYKTLNFLV